MITSRYHAGDADQDPGFQGAIHMYGNQEQGNRGIDPGLQSCAVIGSVGWRDGVTRAVEFFGPIHVCAPTHDYPSTAGAPGLTTMLWRDKDVDETRRQLNPALLIWRRCHQHRVADPRQKIGASPCRETKQAKRGGVETAAKRWGETKRGTDGSRHRRLGSTLPCSPGNSFLAHLF